MSLEQDWDEAMYLWEYGSNKGDADCMYLYATMGYSRNILNKEESKLWLQKAASLGHSNAIRNLEFYE